MSSFSFHFFRNRNFDDKFLLIFLFRFNVFADYAVAVFHEGLINKRYECYLEPYTRLPMMYIEDCLSSLLQFLNAPTELLRRRVYNVTAMSFTPEELFNEVLKHIPDLKISYKPDARQFIGMFM